MKKASTKRRTEETAATAVAHTPDVITSYNKLMAHAELVSVSLVRSSASFHAEHFGGEELAVHVDRPRMRGGFHTESRTLNCGALLSVKLVPKKLEGAGDAAHVDAEAVVDVEAEYGITYHIPDGVEVSDDLIQMFASRNAVFGAWPFFRELAHSLVARMDMPPLVVPLFRMPPLPKAGTH